jgi:pimeloyl-ACP methyl ester carboxylesterase
MSAIAHPETNNDGLSAQYARQKLLATLPVTERRVQCAGVATTVLEGGDGPPVVLLHGPFGYAAHWLRVIPTLTKTHRVIAPDLPGHGSSEAFAAPVDADHVLAWLDELIGHCAGTTPAIVGQTVGGAIAARFADVHGERVRGLVLVDTFGLSPFEPQPEFARALTAFVADPTKDTHERLWRQCAFDLESVRAQMGRYWEPFEIYNLDRARTPTVAAAAQVLIALFGTEIPRPRLEAITVPTTLIWGRHDRATSVAVAQAASKQYGWPLSIIEDASDDPPLEQPMALLRAIREALGERS